MTIVILHSFALYTLCEVSKSTKLQLNIEKILISPYESVFLSSLFFHVIKIWRHYRCRYWHFFIDFLKNCFTTDHRGYNKSDNQYSFQ